jgi:hypothetical protein
MAVRQLSRRQTEPTTSMPLIVSLRRHKPVVSFVLLATALFLSSSLLDYDEPEYRSRFLSESGEQIREKSIFDIPTSEELAALALIGDRFPSRAPPEPYSLENVLAAATVYKDKFGMVIYDPAEGNRGSFTLYYDSRKKWKAGCHKLVRSFESLTLSLRKMFPDSFDGKKELVLGVSSGDFPGVYLTDCVVNGDYPCFEFSDKEIAVSPVLQFGSSFANPVTPSEIPMPMPQRNQLGCFTEWVIDNSKMCSSYLPREGSRDGLLYGKESDWDGLIPQVVWRGTDFTYLGHMRKLRSPDYQVDIVDPGHDRGDKSKALKAMRTVYDQLVPRWKGVILTAEAEADALKDDSTESSQSLPWANIKFSHFMSGGKKTYTSRGKMYTDFQSAGIPVVGEVMSLDTFSKYKYHIDCGGGGGTTWTGTLEKLALPGLLFHHITPTKDYFHDVLIPWVHFVPVKEDLSDLKSKFEWAESNQLEAKRIASRGTEWVRRWYGSLDGFGATFDTLYRKPLSQVVNAYQPVDDWRQVLETEGESMKPIMRCSGFNANECEYLNSSLDYHANHSS